MLGIFRHHPHRISPSSSFILLIPPVNLADFPVILVFLLVLLLSPLPRLESRIGAIAWSDGSRVVGRSK